METAWLAVRALVKERTTRADTKALTTTAWKAAEALKVLDMEDNTSRITVVPYHIHQTVPSGYRTTAGTSRIHTSKRRIQEDISVP